MSTQEIRNEYQPLPWQVKYHKSMARHKCCAGAMGSGKSVAAIQEHLQLALEYPGSLHMIGRQAIPDLRISTLRTFKSIVPRELIATMNEGNNIQCTLINGSQFVFRPVGDEDSFKSAELASFFIDEANEIGKESYDMLKNRLRQVLPGGLRPRYMSTIALNPGDEDHWIPQLFLFNSPKDHEIFQSTTFDNMANLPEEYIDGLKETYSKDKLNRLLYGQFTKVHPGRPVFPQFSKGNFVASVEYDPTLPLCRGFDFGFNSPACVWLQKSGDQVRVLAEAIGKQIYLADFIKDKVLPLQNDLFGHIDRTFDACDPRGSDKSDKGMTSIQILNGLSIYPVHRRTSIMEGIEAIRKCLDTRNIKSGNPNFLIHPRCKNLIEGFRGGYHRIDGEDYPHKDGVYDHANDALRYILLHLQQRGKVSALLKNINDNNDVYVNPRTGYRREGDRMISGAIDNPFKDIP